MATALEKYIDSKNSWFRVTGDPVHKVPTNATECEQWFQKLEGDLSPENLHCDGEITRAQAHAKYKQFNIAWRQLEKIAGGPREQRY